MKRKISAIVALSKNNCIGLNEKLPWHYPEDLKYFKKITLNSIVIMGRKTFESIGKPLKNRKNIVISASYKESIPWDFISWDIISAYSIENALAKAQQLNLPIFIIGGASLYNQTISLIDKIYVTKINKHVNGDTFFPKLNLSEWKEIKQKKAIDKDLEFVLYKRI